MAVEVRIPTILRQYTGGAKRVEGSGDTLSALIDDLELRYPGLRDRLLENGALRRFVNVYLNDEDVRFLDGEKTAVSDGDSVTVLPAVAGGRGALPSRGREAAGRGALPSRGREAAGRGALPSRGREAAGRGALPSRGREAAGRGALPSRGRQAAGVGESATS